MMLEYDKLYLGDLEDYFNFRPNQSNLDSKTSARGANIVECILELKISIHLNLYMHVNHTLVSNCTCKRREAANLHKTKKQGHREVMKKHIKTA